MADASTESGCDGCRHRSLGEQGDWCYLFREAPSELPCGQHDKFETQRKLSGRLVTEHPEILAKMIGFMSN